MFPRAIRDVQDAIAKWELWTTFGFNDVRARYRRSRFGQWWLTIGVGIFISVVGLFYSRILDLDLSSYLPYFAIGYITWVFIAAMITEGAGVFIAGWNLLLQGNIPFSALTFQLLTRNLIVFGHNVLVVPVVFLVYPWDLNVASLLIIPGLLLTSASLWSLALIIGVLSARFRDVQQLILVITPLLFLVTPVLWRIEASTSQGLIRLVELNPFYYWLQAIRGPMLGESMTLVFWSVCALLSVSAVLMALWTLNAHQRRIAFWL